MSLPDGGYKSSEHEAEILKKWIESGSYKPEFSPSTNTILSTEEMKQDPREPWSLICPPPNAYGRPHIGNISGYAYMDAMARYQRMNGKKVLVLPGKDHAGLEGEGVFVRDVLEKKKIRKFDLPREEFYSQMMDWMQENMKTARKDEQDIGLSADFDRDTFTLDPDVVETVLDTFVEMYNDKKIYKGVRIINYDIKARTAVADNQIEYKDSETPFFYFKYILGEPVLEAIQLKEKFKNQSVKFKALRNKTTKGEDMPFMHGQLSGSHPELVSGSHQQENNIDIIGIGYSDNDVNELIEGNAVGILMSLNENYKLVVVNENFDGDLSKEIENIFLFESKYYAGSHIISFDEHPDDKSYTNGLVIGTVRPETVFADTAIACDPKDDRYKEFVGKEVEVEFLGEKKKLNFIEDHAVDKDFGTGLLKVTPAHAVEDWEIALRHPEECMPPIQVINYDLTMTEKAGKFAGMRIKEAREAMREEMQKHGNLVYVDDNYKNRVAIAERTKAPIEPLLSSQWYLKYDGMKEAAIDMVKDGDVTLHPKNMEGKFNHWMENLRDWAISRSLWWGYRLPVWYNGEVKEEIGPDGQVRELINQNGEWVQLEYDNSEHLMVQKEKPGEGWKQDDNVLDTWFSSGQWVYATLQKYNLMDTFFPTDVMVSGFDILENWDSRMMMFTHFKHKEVPFKNLYLTGLVKGTDGQKMSKSRKNLINIDEVKEKYGTDAVRMVYYYQNSAGSDYSMTYEKLDTFKKFVNKLWNASKFVMMNIEDLDDTNVYGIEESSLKLENSKKLLKHINDTKDHISKNMESFDFGLATYNLYHAFWHDFCDIFLESSKPYVWTDFNKKDDEEKAPEASPEERKETQQVLLYGLKTYIKLLHPFMPFVTQRIWQELPKEDSDHEFTMYSKW